MPGEVITLSVWKDQLVICAVQIDYGFQLLGINLQDYKAPVEPKKVKPSSQENKLIKEESINTASTGSVYY
jgi:hypothetical protein